MELIALSKLHWPLLHRLMVLQNFPQVPPDFKEAERYFNNVEIHGVLNKGQLIAAFLFGDITEGSAYIDVVCAPRQEGKWASRKLLRLLANLAFKRMGLSFLWAEVTGKKAIIASLKAGFVPVGKMKLHKTTMVLTAYAFNYKFNLNKQGKEKIRNGFIIQNKGASTSPTTAPSLH